jgi:N-acetylneuraminic acid mutarotase
VADAWGTSAEDDPAAPLALPVARHSAATCLIGDKVYLFGGVDAAGQVLKRVDVYDLAAGTWSRTADLPTPRALLTATVFEGKVWAIGGVGPDGRATNAVEVYQP